MQYVPKIYDVKEYQYDLFFGNICQKSALIATPLRHISLVYLLTITYLLNLFVETLDEKRFMELLTSLQYKPLYNINRSEKWGKKNKNRGL